MKKFLFILLLLAGCTTDSSFFKSEKDNAPVRVNDGISPLVCPCTGAPCCYCEECCTSATYKIGHVYTGNEITHSTPANAHWFMNLRFGAIALSNGNPLPNPNWSKSQVPSTITIKIHNKAEQAHLQKSIKYKDPFGNWITLAPGQFGFVTRDLTLFSCTSAKNLFATFNTEVWVLNCQGTSPNINTSVHLEVSVYSATNGYTAAGLSGPPYGYYSVYLGATGFTTCPV